MTFDASPAGTTNGTDSAASDKIPLTILYTGAAGRIGQHVLAPLQARYRTVRTFDQAPVPGSPDGIPGQLTDAAALMEAMQGVDVLMHFAAQANEAPFLESLVPNNVVGLYNAFHAAQKCGVKRIVYASTCQTVLAYPRDRTEPIEATEPPRPVSLYGATKILGEAMGRWYYDRHKIEFVGIRIGAFQDYESESLANARGLRDIWLSPRDAVTLFQCAIEKPDVGYAVVFGTSRTGRERLSLSSARELLGYEPADDIRTRFPEDGAPPATGG